MPEEVPAELQEKFMDLVDSCIYKTIHNTKTNYERRVRKNKKELILNQICIPSQMFNTLNSNSSS